MTYTKSNVKMLGIGQFLFFSVRDIFTTGCWGTTPQNMTDVWPLINCLQNSSIAPFCYSFQNFKSSCFMMVHCMVTSNSECNSCCFWLFCSLYEPFTIDHPWMYYTVTRQILFNLLKTVEPRCSYVTQCMRLQQCYENKVGWSRLHTYCGQTLYWTFKI